MPPCVTEPEYCEVHDSGTEALYVFEATAGFVETFEITENLNFFWIVDEIT